MASLKARCVSVMVKGKSRAGMTLLSAQSRKIKDKGSWTIRA